MSTLELQRPPIIPSSQTARERSRLAPQALSALAQSSLPYPLSLLFSSDAISKYTSAETLFYSCLQTGDNASAKQCLDALIARFGADNERVMGLAGVYAEATAADTKALEGQLEVYKAQVKEAPANMVIRKRGVALLKSMGRLPDAVQVLVTLVQDNPIDAESWAELGELYVLQGLWGQAVYCFEEVLLGMPNAWNVSLPDAHASGRFAQLLITAQIHARLAEILYLSTQTTSTSSTPSDATSLTTLTRALKSSLRSIELCPAYLRAFYSLHLITTALLTYSLPTTRTSSSSAVARSSNSTTSTDTTPDFPTPSQQTVQKLRELATAQLAEIVRRSSAGETGWTGYDDAEVAAAREVLSREGAGVAR